MSTKAESCVFLLENDKDIMDSVNQLCEEQGEVDLHCFSSWEELQTSLTNRSPRCLILSQENSSQSMVKRITDITRTYATIPVIVLGLQQDLMGAVASIQAGAIDYIEKPSFAGRLAQHIAALAS
ncbi:response regulator [Sansalvadorimonas sp. 2012CJ34-2]|uniref:Response regulator n=1 Tax=Parendozoicomonas callyspongiae TaxID=2942213 RepID=A0ABT0PK25_9GAMM|nr:response regulator [Sansalvadorimonas sp. 2012CJ34-2]MCL6271709.1 response regulator [Sansalvadorimonas sp. 2012CJ34-2]